MQRRLLGCSPTSASNLSPTHPISYSYHCIFDLQLCARQCAASAPKKSRCLDIGCAVGGAAFEMARDFEEVVGFDFSAAFIDAANSMKVRLDPIAPRKACIHCCEGRSRGL